LARPSRSATVPTTWITRLGIIVALLLSSFAISGSGQPASGETGVTTAFQPVEPFRLTDTRTNVGFRRLDANTIRVQVAGSRGIADDAEAVAVSIAATGANSTGYVIGYPAGGDRRLASQINYSPGHTVSTGAVIPLNKGGAFDVYSRTPVDLVIDVTGSFVARTASREGRFEPLDSTRVLDTRETRALRAGGTTTVTLPDAVGKSASAALVTITSTAPNGRGHFTAYAGGRRPNTATLNVSTANATRGTTAIVPVEDRQLKIYSSGGGHVIVDLIGWFTGPYAERSSSGLFVPTLPKRLLDTRSSAPMQAGEARSFPSGNVGTVLGTLTMFETTPYGHGVLYPNGRQKPGTSSINISSTPMISNLAVSRTTKAGVSLYSNTTAHYVFDQFGYFTGSQASIRVALDPSTPAPPPAPSPSPSPSPTPSGCYVSDKLVPSCGVWFGASTPNRSGGYDYAKGLNEYENVAQNTPDILHFYKTGSQRFPTSEERAMSERSGKQRSLLLYNWKPSGRDTWRQIANGAADSEINTVAQSIKAYPHKLFLNIYHEPEDNVRTSSSSGMTPADYADMYRYVVNKLRQQGVDNAVFVWNPMGYYGWRDYLDGLYPGNSYVDWVCYDPYAKNNIHKHLGDIINRNRPDINWPGFYNWATAKAPGKPLMFCEWGVDLKTNSNPASIIDVDAEKYLKQYPMLKALVYWNDIDEVNARIDESTSKGRALGAAYRRLAAQPIFNAMTPNSAP
jgi:beta-mannanase